MATKMNNDNFNLIAQKTIVVEGYVRINFVDNCWINEIIQIIVQFYMGIGGSLYVFGNGDDGCLGIEKFKDRICKVPTICPPFNEQNALDVAASTAYASNATLVLDIDGQVWSFGQGYHGQLGNGKEDNVYTPQKLDLTRPVIAIALGAYHSLILFGNGIVQSFGQDDHGQLGLNSLSDNEEELLPKTIDALKNHKIIGIAAGSFHSVCLSEKGIVFCFGDNESGTCGVGKDKGNQIMIPMKIELDQNVVFIDCGDTVTFLICSNGQIYSCGDGEYGQLGHGDESHKYIPTRIEAFRHKKIVHCAAGGAHSICIDEEAAVYGFGCTDEGQCGFLSDIDRQLTPKLIEYFSSNNIKAVNCYAECNQSAVISQNGSLYVFGDNEKHQLGLDEPKNYTTPHKLQLPQNKAIIKVAMGPEFTALITK